MNDDKKQLNYKSILNIPKNTFKLDKKEQISLLAAGLGIPLASLFVFKFGDALPSVVAFMMLLIIMGLGLSVVHYILSPILKKIKAKNDSLYTKFAEDNGFSYLSTVPKNLIQSDVFFAGRKSKQYTYFNITKEDFSIFFFSFSVGSKDHRRLKRFVALVIPLNSQVPNVYAYNKNSGILDWYYKDEQLLHIKLTREFERKYEVYAQQDYEIEALQLLDLRLIEACSNLFPDSDFEFIDSNFLVYLEKDYGEEDNFQTSFQKAYELGLTLTPVVQEITKNFSFTQLPQKENRLDRRLFRKAVG